MKSNIITLRRRAALFCLAVLLVFSLIACGGEGETDAPAASPGFYVYDEAGVLDAELEEYIIAQNDALFALTGAQVVVACVDTTGYQDTGKYAESLFNSWGIGSAEKNNGVLLLLTISEQDYWCMQGKGLEDTLSSGTIKLMLNQYLEPDFAAAQYGDGVKKIFDAIIGHLETVYSVRLSSWDGTAGEYTPATGDGEEYGGYEQHETSDSILGWAIIIVLVIIIVIALKNGGGGGGGGGGTRRQHRRTVYTTPRPRTTSYGTTMPRPTYRPPSRPGGTYGGSRPGGSFGGSRPGGSFGGSRPGGSFGGSRSGGGGFTRGGGAGRR